MSQLLDIIKDHYTEYVDKEEIVFMSHMEYIIICKKINDTDDKSEKDNKHSIIISNAPKPIQISMYCVV